MSKFKVIKNILKDMEKVKKHPISDLEFKKAIANGYRDSRELLTSDYWIDHLVKDTGMTRE